MLERRSALAKALAEGGHGGPAGAGRLRLGEVRGWTLVQAAAFPATLADLASSLAAALGLAGLPARIGIVVEAGPRRILKTGPEQFWILAPAADPLAVRLRQVVTPAIGAVTELSHSRSRIFIEGAAAAEVMARGIPLDFHPAVFAVGQFALTGLHHTPVLVHRSAEARYEIYAMRSFALSIWEWLIDAALPFGFAVETPAGAGHS
jgi:heterotetrameric sarcosine oxidase gamma subunit